MKKYHLLSLCLLMGLGAFAQDRVVKTDNVGKATAVKKAVGNDISNTTNVLDYSSQTRQSVVSNRYENFEESETMWTYYDLQSNFQVSNRMYQLNDGSVAVAATMSHEDNQSVSDRGTGYNFSAQQGETYWTPDPSIYANNMTITTEVTFNGITQDNMDLEIGAFCGDELRGSVKMMYVPSPLDKHIFFLMVYGESNDEITFKIYDHGTETVQDLICHTNVYFEVNATIGGMAEPYTIEFTTPVDIVTNSDPEEGGVVIGSGAYHVGETVTLTATANEGFFFVNWTENDEEISTNSTYSFTIEEAVGLPAVRNITAHFDVLSIPTNLAAEAIDAQSIALSWDAAENALSYNVYRGEEFVANVATNSYTDNGLNPFTDYCYTVTSVRGELETEASEEACAKTLDLPVATPTNVAATAVDTQSIALSWDAMENALSYNVYKAGELLANVTNNSYTDEGLEYYTEYCYTVTTVRNEQETEPSAEVCEKTMDLPIATPTNFTATAIDTQSIALSWNVAENALSYNIYKAGELLINVTETSYTDEGLEYNTEYCYTVSAVRNEQESEQTEEVCIKTLGESINEHELSFNIYPNPVRDNLFIETEMNIEEVSIYNIMGVMIYSESSFNNEPIDVSNFAEGTYIIKINTDNGNVNYSRIIVK